MPTNQDTTDDDEFTLTEEDIYKIVNKKRPIESKLEAAAEKRASDPDCGLSADDIEYIASDLLSPHEASGERNQRIRERIEELPEQLNRLVIDVACAYRLNAHTDAPMTGLWSRDGPTMVHMPQAMSDPPLVQEHHRVDQLFHLGFNLGAIIDLFIDQEAHPESLRKVLRGILVALVGEPRDRLMDERSSVGAIINALWNVHDQRVTNERCKQAKFEGHRGAWQLDSTEAIIGRAFDDHGVYRDGTQLDLVRSFVYKTDAEAVRAQVNALLEPLADARDTTYEALYERLTEDIETVTNADGYQGLDPVAVLATLDELQDPTPGTSPPFTSAVTLKSIADRFDIRRQRGGGTYTANVSACLNRLASDERGDTWTDVDVVTSVSRNQWRLTSYGWFLINCITEDELTPALIANLYLMTEIDEDIDGVFMDDLDSFSVPLSAMIVDTVALIADYTDEGADD